MKTYQAIESASLVGWTRYYSQYAETTSQGLLTKWYFFGGMRVASETSSDTAWQTAALDGGSVRLASLWAGRPVLVVGLRSDAALAAGGVTLLVATTLLLAPWRRKRVVGIAIRKGHAVGVVILFILGTSPWPLVVRPAHAQCTEGCDCPTPTPLPAPEVRHYHHDHLGSTQVISDESGSLLGDIDWQVSGSRVTGTMTKNGRRIATFEGKVDGSEIRGTFETSAGSTGSWTAEAPARQ